MHALQALAPRGPHSGTKELSCARRSEKPLDRTAQCCGVCLPTLAQEDRHHVASLSPGWRPRRGNQCFGHQHFGHLDRVTILSRAKSFVFKRLGEICCSAPTTSTTASAPTASTTS